MEKPKAQPVYFVVFERGQPLHYNQYVPIDIILQVVEDDVAKYNEVWNTMVLPLLNQGRNVGVQIFHREVKNPFGDFGHKETSSASPVVQQEKEDIHSDGVFW